jgi:hypothetical protein
MQHPAVGSFERRLLGDVFERKLEIEVRDVHGDIRVVMSSAMLSVPLRSEPKLNKRLSWSVSCSQHVVAHPTFDPPSPPPADAAADQQTIRVPLDIRRG